MVRRRLFWGLDGALVAGIYLVAWAIARGPLLAAHPEVMGFGVACDLVLTAAGVHYLLGVRTGGLPVWTTSVVALVGALAVSRLVPGGETFGWTVGLLVAVELALNAFVLWRLASLVRQGREARARGASVLEALEDGLAKALESRVLAAAVVTELRLVALGLGGVFRRTPSDEDALTMHRESGLIAIVAVLLFLSPAEMILVHWLVESWLGSWPAWVVTGLSAYSMLWLWGDAQAVRLHPTRVVDGALKLRVGLRWRVDIPLDDVVAVERTDEAAELDVSVIGEPNLVLHLAEPVTVHGPLGITREASSLSMFVDDPTPLLRLGQSR